MEYSSADIAAAANRAAASIEKRSGCALDFSEASLEAVELALAEAAAYRTELPAHVVEGLVRDFGSYVLEVGRRRHGGRYAWIEKSQEPVLISGEPERRIAFAAWSKVRGRLLGDAANNIPFFYAGYSQRAASAPRGTHVFVT